jgi:hypothetical protein
LKIRNRQITEIETLVVRPEMPMGSPGTSPAPRFPNGEDRTYQTPDGRTVTGGPMEPNSWQLAELFKIENGLIRRIEAIMLPPPYGMNSGWSSWEDGLSSEARDVTMSGS